MTSGTEASRRSSTEHITQQPQQGNNLWALSANTLWKICPCQLGCFKLLGVAKLNRKFFFNKCKKRNFEIATIYKSFMLTIYKSFMLIKFYRIGFSLFKFVFATLLLWPLYATLQLSWLPWTRKVTLQRLIGMTRWKLPGTKATAGRKEILASADHPVPTSRTEKARGKPWTPPPPLQGNDGTGFC